MATNIVPFSKDLAQQLISSGEQFPVDFDAAWEWAGYSRKERAFTKLKKHFVEGKDFYTNPCKSPTGGRPSVSVFLTIDCFKHFCMMAGTEKGRTIRDYFIECERIAKSVQKPLSQIELMQQSIAMLVEHESRLVLVEQQNALLSEQNQLLSQKCALLEASLEAVELETEANAVELDRYKNGHGRYYTVSAWCNLHGYTKSLQQCNVLGRKAVALCRIRGIVPQPVNDPRFGAVNSYPDSVLEELDFS